MQTQTRDPFILLLLKLPFLLTLNLLRITGFICFAPLFIYLSLIKNFIFSPRFETENTYYVIWWLPRNILVLLAFAAGFFQAFYCSLKVYDITKHEGPILSYLALFSTLIATGFFFRIGYRQAFNRLKLGQLKSVVEHLSIPKDSVIDVLGLLAAAGTILLCVQIKKLLAYKPEAHKKTFALLAFKLFYYSFFDLVGMICYYVILRVFRWRLAYVQYLLRAEKNKVKILVTLVKESLNSLVDFLILSPLLLLQLFSPFFTIRYTYRALKLYPVQLWRRIVFDTALIVAEEFVIFPFSLFNALSICRLGYFQKCYESKSLNLYTYYAFAQASHLKFTFDKSKEALQDYLTNVKALYTKSQKLVRKVSLLGSLYVLLDLSAAIFYFFIFVTRYRLKKVQKILQDIDFTYQHLRDYQFQLLIQDQQDEQIDPKKAQLSSVYKLMTVQFIQIVIDTPFALMYLILAITMRWRYNTCPFKKKEVTINFFRGLLDIFFFLLLAFDTLVMFWRLPYILYALRGLAAAYKANKDNNNKSQDKKSEKVQSDKQQIQQQIQVLKPTSGEFSCESPFNSLQALAYLLLFQLLLDLFMIPIFLITVLPLYTIKIFIEELRNEKVQKHQFQRSRFVLWSVFVLLLVDALSLTLNTVLLLTVARFNYAKNLEKEVLAIQKNEQISKFERRGIKLRCIMNSLIVLFLDIVALPATLTLYTVAVPYKKQYLQKLIEINESLKNKETSYNKFLQKKLQINEDIFYAKYRYAIKFYKALFIYTFAILAILLAPQRWYYTIRTFKAIHNKQKDALRPTLIYQNQELSADCYYGASSTHSNILLFTVDICCQILLDTLLAPFFITLTIAPLYTLYLYPLCLGLFKCERHDFRLSRLLIFTCFKYFVYDFLSLIANIFIYATMYHRSTYSLLLSMYQENLEKQREKWVLWFRKVRMKCCWIVLELILFDLLSLPPLIVLYATVFRLKRYRELLLISDKKVEEKLLGISIARCMLKKAILRLILRYKQAVKAIIIVITSIILLLLSIAFMWRLPTLVLLLRDKSACLELSMRKADARFNRFKSYRSVTIFVLKQWAIDVLFLPVTLLTFIASPRRFYAYARATVHRYSLKQQCGLSIDEQFMLKRKNLFSNIFVPSLKELLDCLLLFVILVTGVRIYTLVRMLHAKNYSFKYIAKSLLFANAASLAFDFDADVQKAVDQSKNGQQVTTLLEQPKLEKRDSEEQDQKKIITPQQCISWTAKQLLIDVPYLLLTAILVVLIPWRILSLYTIWREVLQYCKGSDTYALQIQLNIAEEAQRPRHQRQKLFSLLHEAFFYDYPCLILSLFLIASVYKARAAYRLFIFNWRTHVTKTQIIKDFNYRKRLWLEFKRLMYDIQMCVQYLLIMLLVVRYTALRRRLHRLRKRNNALQWQKRLLEVSIAKQNTSEAQRKQNTLNTVSFNVFSLVAEFLDVDDLARLSCTNQRMRYFSREERFYETLYNNQWAKFADINRVNSTFRQLCKQGFILKKEQERGKPISEEQKDIIYGYQYIVYEEYLYSLFYIPHFLATPTKILGLVLLNAKTNQINIHLPNTRYRVVNAQHFCDALVWANTMIDNGNNKTQLKQFEFLHLAFIYRLCSYISKAGYYLTYYLSLPWYFIFKTLNCGTNKNIVINGFNNQYQGVTREYKNPFVQIFFYSLQHLAFMFTIQIYLILAFAPIYLMKQYSNYSWVRIITGPFGLNIFYLYGALTVNATILQIAKAFPYFKPFQIYILPFIFACKILKLVFRMTRKVVVTVAKPIYDIIVAFLRLLGQLFKGVFKLLVKEFKQLVQVINKIFTSLIKTIRSIVKIVVRGYSGTLGRLAMYLLKFGMAGDALLTFIALAWMFWPLAIAYQNPKTAIIIPAVIFSVIFMVTGYRRIQREWENAKNR